MTNKIIIDGVDVSKCEFYCSIAKFYKCCDCLGTKARENSLVGNLDCEENPNCYFKQNARAKEEIIFCKNVINSFAEKLGIEKPKYTTNKDFAEFMDKVDNKLQAKEQENIKYKKIIKKIKNLCAEHPFCDCSCGQDILNVIENVNEMKNEQ